MVMRYFPGLGVGHTYSWDDSAAMNEAFSEIDPEVTQEDKSDDENHILEVQEDDEDVGEEGSDSENEREESGEEDQEETQSEESEEEDREETQSDDDEFFARHEEEY